MRENEEGGKDSEREIARHSHEGGTPATRELHEIEQLTVLKRVHHHSNT